MSATDGSLDVSPKNIEYVISSSQYREGLQPVWTVADLAEYFDVVEQTIRNHIDEVEEFPGIETMKIDRATVYYKDRLSEREDRELNLASAVENYKRGMHVDLVEARAKWLWESESATPALPGGRALNTRMQLFVALRDYVKKAVRFQDIKEPVNAVLNEKYDADDVDGELLYEEPEPDWSSWDMGSDLAKWFFCDALFLEDTPVDGDIQGVAGLTFYFNVVNGEIQDGKGNVDVEEIDADELADALPSVSELISAGELFDRFATTVMGWKW